MQRWLRSWRWAWWWARPRRPRDSPPADAWPHPPYYGDRAQLPDRDYATKAHEKAK